MRIELFTSDAIFPALRPEWEELWRNAMAAHAVPVTRVACPLVERVRHDRSNHRDTVYCGRLAGVLPLYILDEPKTRKLLPIGAGITDYCDILLARDAPSGAAQSLLEVALTAAGNCGVAECALLDLPPHSPLRTAVVPAGWKERAVALIPCPVLSLPASGDLLRDTIPTGRIRDIRQYQHRARRVGGWSIETANSQTANELLAALIDLHKARWHSRGGSGLFSDYRLTRFTGVRCWNYIGRALCACR